MNTQDDGRLYCPRCGAEYQPQTPGGACPACAFGEALSAPSAVGGASELTLEDIPVPAGQGAVGKDGAADPAKTIFVTGIVEEQPGSRIGRYKLLQQIGEGGCGVVYMAEQEEPIHRRVAFKVIKLGMDTKQVIARFEAERQALALMDHPNIAKVLDAGTTETGRPYFVMELVRGVKITDYCDQHKLSTAERLRLFIQVCRAIQHAHYKGIIHRDIKPSNVLVTEVDGVPSPKVIDFGIAKAIGPRLTDKTLFTQFDQLLGTPAYASPEQVGLGGMDVDARSDIYSLGVLLYELLTGRTPFETKQLLEAGLEAFLRVIRETEPPKPATRLTTLSREELTEVAARRQATPEKLNRLVRGEMDWMVMKALEKDRRRRYESAAAFAEDLERWVESKPILARPAGPRERVVKWARRKPALAGLVGVCFAAGLLLVAMFAISTVRVRAALHRERQSAYANGITLADQALVAGNLDQANHILESDCHPSFRRWEWHYLKRRAHPELLAIPILGLTTPAAMAFSPDGKHLAVPGVVRAKQRGLGAKYCIRIVDPKTGDDLRTLGTYESPVTSLVYSPDGQFIAASGLAMVEDPEDKRRSWPRSGWRVLDVETGKQLFQTLTTDNEDLDQYFSRLLPLNLAFSPDSRRVAFANWPSPEFTVLELPSGRQLTRVAHGLSSSCRLVWSPDSQRLTTYQGRATLAKAEGKTVGPTRVWDASDGRLILEQPPGAHMCDFSRDSRWLYISGGGTLRAWDIATDKEVPSFTHVGSGGGSPVVSPDGGKLACTLGGDRIMIRDARTGLALHTLEKSGNQMAFSPDGKRLATFRPELIGNTFSLRYFKTTTCSIWDVDTGELLNVLAGIGFNAVYHPDGKRLATAAPSHEPRGKNPEEESGVIRILDTEAAPAPFEFPPEFSCPIAFSPAGGYLALCEHTNQTVMAAIFDIQTGRKIMSTGPIVREREQVRIYVNAKGVQVERPTGNSRMVDAHREVSDMVFSPDGRVLASASSADLDLKECEVKLWDAQTGRELLAIRRPRHSYVGCLSFKPDGRQLAFRILAPVSRPLEGYSTEVCDTSTGKSVFHSLEGGSPVFSADGRFLATYSQLWDPQTGRPIITLRDRFGFGGVTSVLFDPAGRRLAVITDDDHGTIRLFNVNSGELRQTFGGDSARIESFCFTPDGERLVCSTGEGPVRLWDTRTGRCILTLPLSLTEKTSGGVRPLGTFTPVAVSSDGGCIATGGDRVRLWRAAPDKTK